MPDYRPEILDALAAHGLVPAPTTEPALLRRTVSRLYRYEIRVLRDRCRAGDFPVRDLAGRVVALRRRYLLLSTPIDRWTIDPG
ncbi:MAG: hypothetical protein R2745_21205 [Vicinamibacterales bacterium]